MSIFLKLNESYVQNGLGTLTHIIAADGLYNVQVQATVPTSLSTDQGAGSGRDLGTGPNGGFAGAQQVLQTTSHGQTGLGQAFPNVPANSAPGVATTTLASTTPNLPSIAAGSGTTGLSFGGTAAGSPAIATPAATAVTSGLVVTVLNGITLLYTSPTITPTQGSLQFKFGFAASAADSITVVLASSNANDATLAAVKANISLGQGL